LGVFSPDEDSLDSRASTDINQSSIIYYANMAAQNHKSTVK